MLLHFMSIFLQKSIVRNGFSLLTTKEKNGAIAKLHSGSKFMFSGCDLISLLIFSTVLLR